MIDDGTGLREAELDARTIYDIACIRADASNATREDVEFKAIALRNYKAIAALSAVAPPPVLEADEAMARHWIDRYAAGIDDEPQMDRIAEALAASPAAPAQPEGGDALPDALMPVADEWYRLCERRFSVERMTISGQLAEAIVAAVCTRPAPAQQAVTVDDAMAKRFIEAMRDSDGFLNSLSPAYVKDALTIALTSTAAKAAEGAK